MNSWCLTLALCPGTAGLWAEISSLAIIVVLNKTGACRTLRALFLHFEIVSTRCQKLWMIRLFELMEELAEPSRHADNPPSPMKG